MLVVSRFNEDVSWVDTFTLDGGVQIYNKGESLKPWSCLAAPYYNAIQLPNVGRESHTYLYHIITNYHRLDDLMVFSQGNYSDHFPLSPEQFKEKLFDVGDLGFSYKLQKLYNACHGMNLSNHKEFVYSFHKAEIANPRQYNLQTWWEQTTGEKYYVSPLVFWTGTFSVRKEFILKRSLDSYIKIYQSLTYHENPVEGQFCERTWFNILNIPFQRADRFYS
jgi:hypothetical protein